MSVAHTLSLLAGEDTVREGRCNGLSGRFVGVKVGPKCHKHGDKHGKHADRQPRPDMPHPDEPLPEEGRPDMPGARRSLAGHHDKHDKKKHGGKGKHHDADAVEGQHKDDKHHGKHGDKKAHQKLWDNADMTFEDFEGTAATLQFYIVCTANCHRACCSSWSIEVISALV